MDAAEKRAKFWTGEQVQDAAPGTGRPLARPTGVGQQPAGAMPRSQAARLLLVSAPLRHG